MITTQEAVLGIEIITAVMMVAIILVYGANVFFITNFLLKAQWNSYSHVCIFTLLSSLGMCVVFIILLVRIIIGDPVEISFYGGMIIRPFVFLVGASMAGNSLLRLKMLKDGGVPWKPRTSKS